MESKIEFAFSAEVWQYHGIGGWFFVSFPESISAEIRNNLKWQEEGWGRLKATAKTGNTAWKTSIWFDTKKNTYLLPLKAEIRKREHIEAGNMLNIIVKV